MKCTNEQCHSHSCEQKDFLFVLCSSLSLSSSSHHCELIVIFVSLLPQVYNPYVTIIIHTFFLFSPLFHLCLTSLIPNFTFTSHKLWVLIGLKDESPIYVRVCERSFIYLVFSVGRSVCWRVAHHPKVIHFALWCFALFVWRSNECLFLSEFVVPSIQMYKHFPIE